ncbi:MAG: 1-deoxy-D-xylulose-5-phosphate reductoisomerase, partial [Scrofimicrobium sp.]
MIDVVILGSTGSIGTQALEVVRKYPERFNVVGIAAGGSDPVRFARQIREFSPKLVAVAKNHGDFTDQEELGRLRTSADSVGAELAFGFNAVSEVAGGFSTATVLNGINGGVGLAPTLAALEAGSTLALANKESLVVGAPVVKKALQRPGQIVPVDSEHSAIAQALMAGRHNRGLTSKNLDGESDLYSLVLTASGGPFRGMSRGELRDVTATQALAHPTWSMGPVVTINSSTLMNKGLEIIEASILFDVPPSRITPLVHPQSIVHSMVTWNDGSTVAQSAYPNMRVPIALGMDWPNHLEGVGAPLNWIKP